MYQRDMYTVTNYNIGTMDLSDHAPVYLNAILDTEEKRIIWSLNTGTLDPNKNRLKEIF